MPNIQRDKTGARGLTYRSRCWSSTARRWLAAVTVVLTALGLVVAGGAAAMAGTSAGSVASAGSSSCTRTVTGVHHGALKVSSGRLCLNKATQDGAVTVSGSASLQVSGSTIKGALTVSGRGPVLVCSSTLTGAVRADGVAGAVTFGGGSCGDNSVDTGTGPLTISGSAGAVLITGLRQKGAVKLTGNTGGVTVTGASITGAITVNGNKGSKPVVITGSAITGSLSCSANKPAPTDSGKTNTVSGKATGQCATLAGGGGGGLGAPPPLQQEPPISQDQSNTLPNLNYGEAVGDFTGVGHDQRAYAQDGDLKIADVDKFPGNPVHSVGTDLMATPNDGLEGLSGGSLQTVSVWQRDEETNAGAAFNLTGVKVAADSSHIFMAGATWGPGDALATYRLHLYELPHNGSCASASCAERTADLPHTFTYDGGLFGQSRSNLIVVSSLAVGVIGGQTFIAVGLSDEGIFIFNDELQEVFQIGDMAVPNAGNYSPQTPVTSLAFGPATGPGQGGVLTAGVMSPWEDMFMYRLNANGIEQSMTHAGGSWYTFASAVAQINGQQYAVFGTLPTEAENTIWVMNIDTGSEFTHYSYPGNFPGGLVSGLTPLTPSDGNSGNQQVVVGTFGGATDFVLQYVDGKLAPIPVGTGGAASGTADQIYQWFPGYGAGLLEVTNNSASAVTVAMASRPDAGYGCWLNTSVTGGPAAFPLGNSTVNAGATSPAYFAAALTAGPAGDCASAQQNSKGEHATYVLITPAGDPADEHIVKLENNYSGGALSVENQTGGYLNAVLSQASAVPGSWGTWQLTVTGGGAATAVAPTVQGYRLTAAADPANYQPSTPPVANDPCQPVYRFDVTGARWDNVVSAGQVATQIPAMTAQGSTDGGKTWQDLGQLMPSTEPTVTGNSVTQGPASFYWQDQPGTAVPPGEPSVCSSTGPAPMTDVRVVSGGKASSPIVLQDLKAPPDTGYAPTSGIQSTAPGGGANVSPWAGGVDLSTLVVELNPSGNPNGVLPRTDPRYNLVYFEDATTNAVETGLYTPGDYNDYVAAGPYSADGTRGTGQLVTYYAATTSTTPVSVNAVVNVTGTSSPTITGGNNAGSSLVIKALSDPLSQTPGVDATGGISISGCGTSTATCPLAVPADSGPDPALYQAGGTEAGPVGGLLLQAQAITAEASLPLQVGTANAHYLGSVPLTIAAGSSQAKLQETSQFFPTDSVDSALVTVGQLVQALSIPVSH